MSAATATQPLLDRFPAGAIVAEEGRDQPTWRVDRAVLADLARALRDDPESRYDTLLDLCGVDYPERDERFEAVYHLYSMPRAARLRL